MLKSFSIIISSFFFTGYIRGGGTVAAAAAALTVFFVPGAYGSLLWIISGVLLLGTLSAVERENDWAEDDRRIVIDEAAGMLIALFMLPHSALLYFTAFLLFRLLDIFKPFPVRAFEKIGGGAGVMMDDIASGIIACCLANLAGILIL